MLEEQEGAVNFKFGVIYAKHKQESDDEMLSNGKENYDPPRSSSHSRYPFRIWQRSI